MSVYMCPNVCFKYVIYFMSIIAQLRVKFSPLSFKNGNTCTFFFLFFWPCQAACGILVPRVCILSHFSCIWPYGLEPTRLLCPWDSPGKNTGAGCHATSRGSSQPRDQTHIWLHLLHCRWISLPSGPPGKPLVPYPEIKPMSPAPSVNHWTTSEVIILFWSITFIW